jgi:peptidoglycan hydrolase CwlO-like protein
MQEVHELKTQVTSFTSFSTGIQEQVQGSLNDIVKDLFEKHSKQETRFHEIEKDIKRVKNVAKKFDALDAQVDQINSQIGSAKKQAQYLVKSLPVQIHMSISEALQKTVGKDYAIPILDFDKYKVEQLY